MKHYHSLRYTYRSLVQLYFTEKQIYSLYHMYSAALTFFLWILFDIAMNIHYNNKFIIAAFHIVDCLVVDAFGHCLLFRYENHRQLCIQYAAYLSLYWMFCTVFSLKFWIIRKLNYNNSFIWNKSKKLKDQKMNKWSSRLRHTYCSLVAYSCTLQENRKENKVDE